MKRGAVVDSVLGLAATLAVVSALARTVPVRPQTQAPPAAAVVAATQKRAHTNAAEPLSRSPFRINDANAADAQIVQVAPSITSRVDLITVRAIVGGPPWSALLAGVTSCGGSCVVRPGDRFHELRILRIDADRVSLAWVDSTWSVQLPAKAAP